MPTSITGAKALLSASVSGNRTSYQPVRRDLALYALWKCNPKRQLRVATANLLAQDTVSESTDITPGAGSQTSRTLGACIGVCEGRWR